MCGSASRSTVLSLSCAALVLAALACSPGSAPPVGRTPALSSGPSAGAAPKAAGSSAQQSEVSSSTAGVGGGIAGSIASEGGSDAGDAGAVNAGDLPCAIQKALATNCQACHGVQHIGGAPMSLVSYDDFKKPAVTKPALTVQQLALMRLTDPSSPMPPGGTISADDKKTLTDWLSAGAPPSTEESPCTTIVGPIIPPDYKTGLIAKPGETCYNLPNHNGQTPGDTTPYSVIPGEHYEQFYFKVPWPAGSVATRFGAKFDNLAVLHHWLLFTTAKPASVDGTHETTIGTQLGDSAQLIGGWAVGGDNITFPDDMGLLLPDSGMLNVQWHFYNQDTVAANDSSIVQVCTVPKAQREKIAGMTWLGTENFNGPLGMPPHQMSKFGGTCPNDSTAPITIWAFWPHMHKLGRHMTSIINRASGTTEMVFDKDFDFNHQVHYVQSPMLVLQPGDTITSTCSFDNETNAAVAFGPSTTQEMCYQFAFSYPAGALDNGVISLIGATNTCW